MPKNRLNEKSRYQIYFKKYIDKWYHSISVKFFMTYFHVQRISLIALCSKVNKILEYDFFKTLQIILNLMYVQFPKRSIIWSLKISKY